MESKTSVEIPVYSNSNKSQIIEKVSKMHINNKDTYLIAHDEKSLNICFFVSDVFRRNGQYIDCMLSSNTPMGIVIYICYVPKSITEIQITKEDDLDKLKTMYNYDVCYNLTIRACGMACSVAWKLVMWLITNKQMYLLSNININAIPVKIDDKNIYKTTINIKLQKIYYSGETI